MTLEINEINIQISIQPQVAQASAEKTTIDVEARTKS